MALNEFDNVPRYFVGSGGQGMRELPPIHDSEDAFMLGRGLPKPLRDAIAETQFTMSADEYNALARRLSAVEDALQRLKFDLVSAGDGIPYEDVDA